MEVLHAYSNKARHYLYHLDQIVEAAKTVPKAQKRRKRAAKPSTKLIHRLSSHQIDAIYGVSKTSVVQLLCDAGIRLQN